MPYSTELTRIGITVSFTDDVGSTRTENASVETSHPGDRAGEGRVAQNLFADFKVTVGEQAAPKHNAAARRWLDFPNRPAGFEQYFDIENSQAMWLELSSLIMGAEGDLILAKAYKALEPLQEPPFEDDAAVNRLYYIHDRKMTLLNQAVYALIKVQDLVNRLLHESLGGDLVDTSKPDWEEDNLRRFQVLKGLERKRAAGLISQADYTAIADALKIPKDIPKAETARAYRNRLMHHIRPSVDHAMFFAYVDSRAGEEIRDQQGTVIGKRHAVFARPPIQYRFEDLYAAFIENLDAIVLMLQRLSGIDFLRR